MQGVPRAGRSCSFSKHCNKSLLGKMKDVILQFQIGSGSRYLSNVSDPDRRCISGSDLLGTRKQQRCTDKPSQDVRDAGFGQDSGPRVISDFLSSLRFCGVFLWLSR